MLQHNLNTTIFKSIFQSFVILWSFVVVAFIFVVVVDVTDDDSSSSDEEFPSGAGLIVEAESGVSSESWVLYDGSISSQDSLPLIQTEAGGHPLHTSISPACCLVGLQSLQFHIRLFSESDGDSSSSSSSSSSLSDTDLLTEALRRIAERGGGVDNDEPTTSMTQLVIRRRRRGACGEMLVAH